MVVGFAPAVRSGCKGLVAIVCLGAGASWMASLEGCDPIRTASCGASQGPGCEEPESCFDRQSYRHCLENQCGLVERRDVSCETGTACVGDELCVRNAPEPDPTEGRSATFCSATDLAFGPGVGAVRLADMTADGDPELLFVDDGLEVAAGGNDATFQGPVTIAGVTAFEVSDLDLDGVAEAVVGKSGPDGFELAIVRADDEGNLTETSLGVTLPAPGEIRVADMNASGEPDLVVVDDADRVMLVLEPLTAPMLVETSVPPHEKSIAVLSKGFGGRALLVLDPLEMGTLVGLRLSEAGVPTQSELVREQSANELMVVGDFDDDGIDDLLLVVPPSLLVRRFGDGETLGDATSVDFPVGANPPDWGSVAVDADADGFLDVLALRADGIVLLAEGHGSAPFEAPRRYLAFEWVSLGNALVAGDVNGDELADLIVSSVPPSMAPASRWWLSGPRLVVGADSCRPSSP